VCVCVFASRVANTFDDNCEASWVMCVCKYAYIYCCLLVVVMLEVGVVETCRP